LPIFCELLKELKDDLPEENEFKIKHDLKEIVLWLRRFKSCHVCVKVGRHQAVQHYKPFPCLVILVAITDGNKLQNIDVADLFLEVLGFGLLVIHVQIDLV
jgi:hypothetical protein